MQLRVRPSQSHCKHLFCWTGVEEGSTRRGRPYCIAITGVNVHSYQLFQSAWYGINGRGQSSQCPVVFMLLLQKGKDIGLGLRRIPSGSYWKWPTTVNNKILSWKRDRLLQKPLPNKFGKHPRVLCVLFQFSINKPCSRSNNKLQCYHDKVWYPVRAIKVITMLCLVSWPQDKSRRWYHDGL